MELAEFEVYQRLENLGHGTEYISDTGTVENLMWNTGLSAKGVGEGLFTDEELKDSILWLD